MKFIKNLSHGRPACKYSTLALTLTLTLTLVLVLTLSFATPPVDRSHSTHAGGKCHDLQFNLLIPAEDELGGMLVLRGIVPVEIEMHPEFKGYGRQEGYGVFISVDYNSVFEEDEIGFKKGNMLDMAYMLDTTKLTNGTHLISVNITDYYLHFGSILLKVIVDNQ